MGDWANFADFGADDADCLGRIFLDWLRMMLRERNGYGFGFW
jgi:hypothetical protein